jgi:hypothetical protein
VADRQPEAAAVEAQDAAGRLQHEVDGDLGLALAALRGRGEPLEVILHAALERTVEPRREVVALDRAQPGRQPLDDDEDVRADDDAVALGASGG